jgi:hypothetical protein
MSDTQPTPGMRARVSLDTVGHGTSDWTVSLSTGAYSSEEQANANAAYLNGLIEADERRHEKRAAAPHHHQAVGGLHSEI